MVTDKMRKKKSYLVKLTLQEPRGKYLTEPESGKMAATSAELV